jgi:hypothetical protein
MSDFVGFHHFYLGIFMVVIGFIIMITGKKTRKRLLIASFIILIGSIIASDDLLQHIIQYFNPAYRSPLHRLFGATLWKWVWVQKLCHWADHLFGRK